VDTARTHPTRTGIWVRRERDPRDEANWRPPCRGRPASLTERRGRVGHVILGGDVPVRLVACDLDGTLLRRDGSISERTALAVRAIDDAGICVVLATARPPRFLREIVEAIPCHPIVVCSNGAFVWDSRTNSVRAHTLISTETAAESIRRVRGILADAVFSVEIGIDGYGCEPHYVGEWPRPAEAQVGAIEDLVVEPVAKLSIRHGQGDPWATLDHVRRCLGDLVEVTRSSPTAPIELLALGVSKASGVAFVAEQLGVLPAEILAVGDMPNDLPLLHWAGRSAAPANAHEDVLTTVDVVLGDCDEDGVAMLIEELAVVAQR
jgi:hydroxymethylpyrimidine pyrophosphatase-like HAD family hydrolase